MTSTRVLLPAVLLLALIAPAQAAIENGSFDLGTDAYGWPVNWTTVTNLYGKVYVVSSYTADDSDELGPDTLTVYTPRTGGYFALLKADGVSQWTSVKQSFTVDVGDILSGWAAFDYQDYYPFIDAAQVRILSETESVIDIPWNVTGPSAFWDGEWTNWSWESTVTGTITLEYRVADFVDSTYDSYAMFDGTTLTQGEVPEPASFLVWAGLGMLVWLPARKRKPRS